MVVAEVPLWVVHPNATVGGPSTNGTGGPTSAILGGDKKNPTKSSKGGGMVNNNNNNNNNDTLLSRAHESLTLLEEGGGYGGGGSQKCAIYAVDIHPNGQKFVTAGGDGTVRLWSTNALFQQYDDHYQQFQQYQQERKRKQKQQEEKEKQQQLQLQLQQQREQLQQQTEDGEQRQEQQRKEEGQDQPSTSINKNQDKNDTDSNSNSNNISKLWRRTSGYVEGGNYESSGESSASPDDTDMNANKDDDEQKNDDDGKDTMDRGESNNVNTDTKQTIADDDKDKKSAEKDDGRDKKGPNTSTASATDKDGNGAVHDLTNVVRRKKDVDAKSTSESKEKEQSKPSSTSTSTSANDQESKNSEQNNKEEETIDQEKKSSSTSTAAHQDKQQGQEVSEEQEHKQNSANVTGDGGTINSSNQHRLLCTMSAHTGCSVLAVRFSTNGQYLASAGDDTAVCIYAPAKTTTSAVTTTGNLDSRNSVEHWTRIKLCRGHALDAVGLAWAPDDSHLVSCSLDSNTPIIVWKLTDLASSNHRPTHANVLCNPYKILGRGIHTSTVKGVTFDPAGTYLASSGDDPSVCVWRAHDDWGLEKRIDANSGIFRQWKEKTGGGGNNSSSADFSHQQQKSLSSQSLFRRLSWSTDGAYICSTNAVVKNKHVASTISRDGWAVSSARSTAAGAANLVGHKQPVVACRHCPFLLDTRPKKGRGGDGDDDNNNSNDDDDVGDDDEPEYATLLALGDKRGFVTVWSTRQSRPVFKVQCSETRCTVTDMTWGKIQNDIMLLVSLLDGQIVAFRFDVPDELGNVLRPNEQARVFQLRYGIDLGDVEEFGGSGGGVRRRLFVGENSSHKFIENALQYSLEDRDDEEDDDDDDNDGLSDDEGRVARRDLSSAEIKASQSETRVRGGKKRIQPLLMPVDSVGGGSGPSSKKRKLENGSVGGDKPTKSKKVDTLEDAMNLAEKAASGAEAAAASVPTTTTMNDTSSSKGKKGNELSTREGGGSTAGPLAGTGGATTTTATGPTTTTTHATTHHPPAYLMGGGPATPLIPLNTDRIHSVELPPLHIIESASPQPKVVADCTNSTHVPQGSSGAALSCAVLTISRGGNKMWRDYLPGASCSAIAASKHVAAVGTSDGSVQLYGTSPSIGWTSGTAFRSHPPFIFGRPIVALQLHDDVTSTAMSTDTTPMTRLLVVSADGTFGVYSVIPELRMIFKGTVMPPMMHMIMSSDLSMEMHLPKMARIQLTDTNRLLLLLSLQSSESGLAGDDNRGRGKVDPSVGAGGSLQAFVYNQMSELWMRVADSRFVLSDFYSNLPSSHRSQKRKASLTATDNAASANTVATGGGELAKLEDSVRMGATSSTLKPSRRGAAYLAGGGGIGGGNSTSGNFSGPTGQAHGVYNQASAGSGSSGNTDDIATRSHCEDRMACALVLRSSSEFEYWFIRYVRTLAITGHESLLRMVVDMLLGKYEKQPNDDDNNNDNKNNNNHDDDKMELEADGNTTKTALPAITDGKETNDTTTTNSTALVPVSTAQRDTTTTTAAAMTTTMTKSNSNKSNVAVDKLSWWLSEVPYVLNVDRAKLVQSMITEMRKNRSLQRLTNEVAIDVEALVQ